jgi:DNA polymerase-3 subunit delta
LQNKDKYPTYLDFEKKIKSGKVDPVYFVLAVDSFFLNKAGILLKEKLTGSASNNENFFIKYADDTPLDEIFDLTSNFSSLFSQKKIIIVKKCEKYSRKIDDVVNYCKNPDPDTVLILSFDRDYVEEKKLNKILFFYDFTSLSDDEYINWLRLEFNGFGCSINDDVLLMFSDYVPRIFDLVENEIRKVSDFLQDRKEKIVTKEVILKLSGYEAEFTHLELMTYILTNDTKNALNVLDYLLNKESLNEIFILNILINMFSDLIAVKKENILNMQNREFYASFKIWGDRINFVKKFQNRAKTLNFERIFKKLIETDQKLKTSMLDPKVLLFSLVQEIASN